MVSVPRVNHFLETYMALYQVCSNYFNREFNNIQEVYFLIYSIDITCFNLIIYDWNSSSNQLGNYVITVNIDTVQTQAAVKNILLLK